MSDHISALVNIVMFLFSMFGFAVFIIAAFRVMAISKKLTKTNELLEQILKKKKLILCLKEKEYCLPSQNRLQ